MNKNKLKLNWELPTKDEDFMPNLTRFRHYLNDRGFRSSTIDGYVGYVKRFLEYAKMGHPSIDIAKSYREQLIQRHLSRSTLNNCGIAIKSYYKMFGEEFDFPFQPLNQTIPFYFDERDIIKIFSTCYNLKHYAMLMTLFYGCLRASELCNLDDSDLDLDARTLKVREGKCGKDGIVYLKDECTRILRKYLEVRPSFKINGKQPLFFTDYGNRWGRRDLHKMFIKYKNLAQIETSGGLHVFARRTPATA